MFVEIDDILMEYPIMHGIFQGKENMHKVKFISINKNESYTAIGRMFARSGVEYVDFNDVGIKATGTCDMFDECKYLEDVRFNGLYLDHCDDMSGTLFKCSSIKRVDLSMVKNGANLRSMCAMCSSATHLEKFSLSGSTNMDEVNMEYMFTSCSNIKEVGLPDLSKVNRIQCRDIFDECIKLSKVYKFEDSKSGRGVLDAVDLRLFGPGKSDGGYGRDRINGCIIDRSIRDRIVIAYEGVENIIGIPTVFAGDREITQDYIDTMNKRQLMLTGKSGVLIRCKWNGDKSD